MVLSKVTVEDYKFIEVWEEGKKQDFFLPA